MCMRSETDSDYIAQAKQNMNFFDEVDEKDVFPLSPLL